MSESKAPHPSKEEVTAFLASFAGRVLTPDDGDNYTEACKVFNANIPSRPSAFLQCRGTSDVVHALKFAQDWDAAHPELPRFVVRAGGHSFSGKSTSVGGLVIDLREMRFVQVDTASKTAWIGAGTLGRDIDSETGVHGLCTVSGQVSDTGVAGLTLGGGYGVLSSRHGLMIDNLLAVEVVLPSGEVVVASDEDNNPHKDLFWAIRGAGTQFGVVTRLRFQLHNVPSKLVTYGLLPFPADNYAGVLAAQAALSNHAEYGSKSYSVVAVGNPPPTHNPVCILVVYLFGARAEVQDQLKLIEDAAGMPPLASDLKEGPYASANRLQDMLAPFHVPCYVNAFAVPKRGDADLAKLYKEVLIKERPPNVTVLCESWNGEVCRGDPSKDAFGTRFEGHVVVFFAILPDPASMLEPTRAFCKGVEEEAKANWQCTVVPYSNYSPDASNSQVFTSTLDKLREIKSKYDPKGHFGTL